MTSELTIVKTTVETIFRVAVNSALKPLHVQVVAMRGLRHLDVLLDFGNQRIGRRIRAVESPTVFEDF